MPSEDLRRNLMEAYLTFFAQLLGINEIEAYRRYQTNAQFHAAINAVVNVALTVVANDEIETINVDLFHDNGKVPPEENEPMWTAFREGLLGG